MRLTGRTLRISARLGRVPVLRAGVRAAGRPQLGLDVLREARLDGAVPYLTPPPVTRSGADRRATG